MIAQVAEALPSSDLQVMVALPAATALTVPSATVATASLLLLHTTFGLVGFSGVIFVTVSVKVALTASSLAVSLSVMPLTRMGLTVTTQVAEGAYSSDLQVMVALPGARALTVPSATVATAGSLLLHTTAG